SRIDHLLDLQNDLHALCVDLEKNPPKTIDAYNERRQSWAQKWKSYVETYDADVKPLLKQVASAGAGQGIVDLYRSENRKANREAASALEAVLREFPADRPDGRAIVSRTARGKLASEVKIFDGKDDEALSTSLAAVDSKLMGIITTGQDSRRIAEVVFDSYARANSAMP